MSISMVNRSASSARSEYEHSPGPVVTSAAVKSLDILNAFNAPPRYFGEHYDSSSHAAVIKMMMMQFGQRPADMFKAVTRSGDTCEVVLRDGYTVQVSDQELQQVAAASRFFGNDEAAISDAHFALAVFIKRKQLSNAQSGNFQGFDAVLSNSLRGETTFNVLKGLGMAGFLRQVPSEQVLTSGGVGVMATDNFGACLVLDGVGHDYGRKRPVDQSYLYVLVNDQAPTVTVPAKIPSVPVKPEPDRSPQPIKRTTEESIPDVSTNLNRKKPEDILNGFYAPEPVLPKHDGIRELAAVIKTLMIKYGQRPADIFEKVTPTGSGFDVVLNKGYYVHISNIELKRTAEVSGFFGNDKEMLEDANFILAAFVKRAQVSPPGGYPIDNFDQSLSRAVMGYSLYNVFWTLGLFGKFVNVPVKDSRAKGSVGITHNFDIVVDNVKYSDGKPLPLADTDTDMVYSFINFVPDTSPLQPNRKISNLSDKPVGAKPDNIWGGFYQGAPGNCVTIAEIKAAMLRFGQHPQSIYQRITETAEGYTVTLRDSRTVRLTYEELKKARASADFRGKDEGMIKDAIFMFAVSAKVAQMTNHEGQGVSYESALATLNNGEGDNAGYARLGLSAFVRRSSPQELASGVPGTLFGYGHSTVVFNGFADHYGQQEKVAGSYWVRHVGDVDASKLI